MNTHAELNFQTSVPQNSFEAFTNGGSWVKARGLRDRNAFSLAIVQLTAGVGLHYHKFFPYNCITVHFLTSVVGVTL